MKTGRTLNDLAAELTRQAESKKDYLADTRALTVAPVGTSDSDKGIYLTGFNGAGLPIRETAHAQLSNALSIPKPYYDRLLASAPALLATNVNHWLHADPARKLVRTLDGGVRAFLSDRFRPLDNYDLAEAVLPKLQQLGARVESCEVTERRLYLKAITPRIEAEVRPGDVVQAGIVVSNSEIGHGSLKIEELSYRLVCTNGMIHSAAIRRNHVGRSQAESDLLEARELYRDETRRADDRALWLKVQDTVAAMFSPDRFRQRVAQYQEASERKIEADPVKVLEVTTKRFGLTADEQGSILRHLVQGADLSAWGLANAVTHTSQEVESYERATELEALGGAIVELPASDWKALAV